MFVSSVHLLWLSNKINLDFYSIFTFKDNNYQTNMCLRLEERAMSLSAANLDEALKLVEDAAERSAGALTAAQATKDQIDSAGTKAAKTDRILQDSIFQDTSR